MESQSFVFLKVHWDIPEPTTDKDLFLPVLRRIIEISLSAINRIHLTEPEQVGFSVASRKINFPVQSDNPQHLQSLFQLLQVFFRSLPAPVCLVAHNGGNFDFPILRFELEKVVKECDESAADVGGTFNNVYCVDSAEGFFKLFAPSPSLADIDKASKHLFDDRDSENVEPNASSLVTCEWNVADFDSELATITEIASKLYDGKNFNTKELESDVQEEYHLTKLSEHGDNKGTGCGGESKWKKMKREVVNTNEKTPSRTHLQEVNRRRAVDLSLEAVYRRVFGETVTPCGIKGEVEALAEIVAQLGIPIVEIFDRMKVPFCSKEFALV